MTRDEIIRMACGHTQVSPRWYEAVQPGDFVIDAGNGDVAVVVSIDKQRPVAPDYYRLNFSEGSYIDVTDNHLAAIYLPYILISRIVADEREACAKVCEDEIARVKPIYSVTAENCIKAIRARGEK
jgi:hypothetical protein